jgi:hypothetical protein
MRWGNTTYFDQRIVPILFFTTAVETHNDWLKDQRTAVYNWARAFRATVACRLNMFRDISPLLGVKCYINNCAFFI